MILHFPQGYDTPIGDAGSGLSGGQKQRIGLARALYGDPSVVVLDEPNSNLDDAGETALTKAIVAMRKAGTTVVIISHRPSILQTTNKLLFMRDGMAQAFGPTDQVLKALAQAHPKAQGASSQPPAPRPFNSSGTVSKADQSAADEAVVEAKSVGALSEAKDSPGESNADSTDKNR